MAKQIQKCQTLLASLYEISVFDFFNIKTIFSPHHTHLKKNNHIII